MFGCFLFSSVTTGWWLQDIPRTFPGHPLEDAMTMASRDILLMLCCARNVFCLKNKGSARSPWAGGIVRNAWNIDVGPFWDKNSNSNCAKVSVGYTQGLNFTAAVLSCVMSRDNAFWCLGLRLPITTSPTATTPPAAATSTSTSTSIFFSFSSSFSSSSTSIALLLLLFLLVQLVLYISSSDQGARKHPLSAEVPHCPSWVGGFSLRLGKLIAGRSGGLRV